MKIIKKIKKMMMKILKIKNNKNISKNFQKMGKITIFMAIKVKINLKFFQKIIIKLTITRKIKIFLRNTNMSRMKIMKIHSKIHINQ